MLTYMKTHKSQPNVGKYTTYMDGMGSGYFHDAVNTALYIHTYICRIYTFTCEQLMWVGMARNILDRLGPCIYCYCSKLVSRMKHKIW